jgi:transposase
VIVFEKRDRAQRAAVVVGVDAGKFTHTLVVRPRGGRDSKPFTFQTTRADFDRAAQVIAGAAGSALPAEVLVGIEFAGSYGFTLAHYLDQLGYGVVSVLPAHTKRWKEVAHNQPLKTDAKDALGITDLAAQGHFVSFPFLRPAYAELRCLVTARERLSVLRRATITQVRSLLQVVFPEFEEIFQHFTKKTPFVLLNAFPGPGDLLAAPKRKVLKVLYTASKGHHTEATYERLIAAEAGRPVGSASEARPDRATRAQLSPDAAPIIRPRRSLPAIFDMRLERAFPWATRNTGGRPVTHKTSMSAT